MSARVPAMLLYAGFCVRITSTLAGLYFWCVGLGVSVLGAEVAAGGVTGAISIEIIKRNSNFFIYMSKMKGEL